MFKCELQIGGRKYDVTDDLKNWDDFELSQKRSSYDGVVRSFSTKFEFVKRAYGLLSEEYRSKYLNASATVVFSLRNNRWEYDEIFRCALDFSTYAEDGYIVSINAVDDTLAAIIKAKKSIQYEYSVSGLKDKSLIYDGLKMQNEGKYTLGGQSVENDPDVQYLDIKRDKSGYTYITYSMPLYLLSNSELPSKDSPLLFKDVMQEKIVSEWFSFVEALSDIGVTVNINFGIYILDILFVVDKADIILGKLRADGARIALRTYTCEAHDPVTGAVSPETIVSDSVATTLEKGESLYLNIRTYFRDESTTGVSVYLHNFSIGVNFKFRMNPVKIDVITPRIILQNLLDSMTEGVMEGKGYLSYAINGGRNLRLERSYIMAAESARGLPDAKIYTSYKKFCEWMEAEFGYIPVIEGNNVWFKHRNELFDSTIVKELGADVNDYEMSVNDSIVYSSIKVGYEKQDYESINGRDEFRFTEVYSTGVNLVDNTLSLISPYRADAYGIEFLIQKRGEDTTDNESDSDVFCVECIRGEGDILELYREYSLESLSGLIDAETMFNISYSPRFMLEANKKYIGAFTSLLKFASSDGNSDISIDGVKETDDFPITERLFTVAEADVTTGDIIQPDNLNGLVSFVSKGRKITGYIKQLSLSVAKEKAAKYTLIVKEIS